MTSWCRDRKESYRPVAQHLLTRASACVGERVYVRHFLVLKASRLPRASVLERVEWRDGRVIAISSPVRRIRCRCMHGSSAMPGHVDSSGARGVREDRLFRHDLPTDLARPSRRARPLPSSPPSRGESAAEEPLLELSSALPRSG
jgi:hypothetical protein